ncbi:unnamed protein product [Schistosoma margrebowiei]|uniref:Uncharacterized protein n=1 Tax=Schistosoma margrebowiei TaxID=48269 RepID=A0A183MWX0_9TREM|nr:unnamed protein product [Schistosoma margrebowiei]
MSMSNRGPSVRQDGDVLSFLKEFEAVAELVGVKKPKAKLVVLGTLLRGRAKAVYDSSDAAGGKTTWETVTERLAAEFDSPVDREEALQKFRLARLPVDVDPPVLAVELTRLLRRALPNLDEESEAQLLASQFIESVPATISQQLKLVNAAQPMDISELAKVTRQLMTRTVAPVGCEKQEISNVEKKIEELEREIAATRVNHKKNDKCYACGGTGHWKINCPTRRRHRYFRRYNECSFYPRNLGVVTLVDRGAVYTRVNINERDLVCLIDTGAAVSLIGKERCRRLKPCTSAVHTIGGHMLEVFGVSNSIVKVGDAEINFPFVVTTSLSRPILGADFLREVRAIVDLRNGKVVTKYGSLPIHESSEVAEIRVAADVSSKKPNINELCKKYAKLFTGDGEPYGFCDKVKHEIPIKSDRVNIFATRRVPVHLEAEITRQFQEMLKEGIIEEADSPYSSLVLLVKKPNGKYRFRVDFRELNNITDLKPCAMPTVVETLDRLQNATVPMSFRTLLNEFTSFAAKIVAANYKRVRTMKRGFIEGEYIRCYDKGMMYVADTSRARCVCEHFNDYMMTCGHILYAHFKDLIRGESDDLLKKFTNSYHSIHALSEPLASSNNNNLFSNNSMSHETCQFTDKIYLLQMI